jgi:carbon starvation protein
MRKMLTNKYFATVITLFFGYLLCQGGYMNVLMAIGVCVYFCGIKNTA